MHAEGAGAWAHPGGSLVGNASVASGIAYVLPTRLPPVAAVEASAPYLIVGCPGIHCERPCWGTGFVMSGLKTKASVQWLCPPPPPPRPLERPLVDGEGEWAWRRPSHPEAQPGSSHIISAHLPLARISQMATLGVGGHPKCHPSLTGRSSTVSSPSVTAGGSHGLLHESERTGLSGAPTHTWDPRAGLRRMPPSFLGKSHPIAS